MNGKTSRKRREKKEKLFNKIMNNKECKNCDFENAIRHGRADWRCPKCGRQLMLELVLMYEAGTIFK